MKHALLASARIACVVALAVMVMSARADAIPVFANGQGVSCETCHTTFPGMTPYGMMTMMTNFQNLNWKKQEQAFPFAVRSQIVSFLGNGDHPQQTMVNALSILGGGFIGKNFTWYTEQPFVDGGAPGITEQAWISWNGLLHGTNSLQVGKAHTWFPFMPAHGWTLGDYLLATQDNGQNTFEPNDARWGYAFNGMSNEFMYSLSYTTSVDPIQHAFDFNKQDGNRIVDFNLSYGGMTQPWTVGIAGIRGTAPLLDTNENFVDNDLFTREGLYYSYQTPKWLIQTMYYHGYDNQPDAGAPGAPFNGAMLEVQRDLTRKDHVLARYDVASSDTLNRQYVIDYAHNFVPNLKATVELGMSPQSHPSIGFALDFAGPWEQGTRFLADGRTVPIAESTPPPIAHMTVAAQAVHAGDVNAGAKLVQANGCEGCHGANLMGGTVGPKLYGIEKRLSADQIADFIVHPRAPMPNFGFTQEQVGDIVAYLSGLDGGANSTAPVVTFDPAAPTDQATITVRFPGTPPASVSVLPIMQMGGSSMQTRAVHLQQSASDSHVFTGHVVFSMGGPWTIRVEYDGQTLDVPLSVGS
ncbi:MAG TPA: c-type cytochrome [Candidatus Baltobacteraceae bacterium]|nr:c-type cytochrome [Candidatus Baltobacteraceae bacterium]